MASIARGLGVSQADLHQETEGTALVAYLGMRGVLKVFPPFLADHHAFEAEMLEAVAGRLSVPTPRLLASGTLEGWPWLLLSRLEGVPLGRAWPTATEGGRLDLLRQIGALMREVHALPVGPCASRAPAWDGFVAQQRARCADRQRRTGLPEHLLDQVPAYVSGPLPCGPDVLLTGEYTPPNLFVTADDPPRLAALFDFGDGLVGPAAYDLLGPQAFLVAGDPARQRALFDGYGVAFEPSLRAPMLRLLLLHRYSHLGAQLAVPDWRLAPDLDALAGLVWP